MESRQRFLRDVLPSRVRGRCALASTGLRPQYGLAVLNETICRTMSNPIGCNCDQMNRLTCPLEALKQGRKCSPFLPHK